MIFPNIIYILLHIIFLYHFFNSSGLLVPHIVIFYWCLVFFFNSYQFVSVFCAK
jgi:hypothetical protein